ncbi:MAG: hypothetical protein IJB73_04180 [Firmicutes bacterium]|nr:hypothetical protein [Bacillota bacterium]MBQ6899878.1 hypothetical protein [Bacillota bacterium]
MSLQDYKFLESMFTGRKISDLSDNPSSDGMTAELLKEYFDYMPKAMIAMGAINGIIDFLTSTAGASGIGAAVTGIAGTEVQSILAAVKTMLDNRYTKETADMLLEGKADRTTVSAMVKSIEFDHATGVFTITEQGGAVHTIDTAIEKIAVNFRYDAEAEALVMTLPDGSEEAVSLSAFVDDNDIQESSTIRVEQSGGTIKLHLKTGSVTDSMLSSALLSAMQGYVQSCSGSAASADASAKNAGTYADNAAKSASAAKVSETNAAQSESNAKNSETKAKASETAALAAQKAAEDAAEEAKTAAGGDFVTTDALNNAMAGKANTPSYAESAMLASGWNENKYSFETVYPFEEYDIEIQPSKDCTTEQMEAWCGAMITGSSTDHIAEAKGDVPTIDIPIFIKVVKK